MAFRGWSGASLSGTRGSFRGDAAGIEATRRPLVGNEKLSEDLVDLTTKIVAFTRNLVRLQWVLVAFTLALVALAIAGLVHPGR